MGPGGVPKVKILLLLLGIIQDKTRPSSDSEAGKMYKLKGKSSKLAKASNNKYKVLIDAHIQTLKIKETE